MEIVVPVDLFFVFCFDRVEVSAAQVHLFEMY